MTQIFVKYMIHLCIFRHLKLEIALAIPASNDKKWNSYTSISGSWHAPRPGSQRVNGNLMCLPKNKLYTQTWNNGLGFKFFTGMYLILEHTHTLCVLSRKYLKSTNTTHNNMPFSITLQRHALRYMSLLDVRGRPHYDFFLLSLHNVR